MSEPLAVRDALTIALLAAGGYCLLRCLIPNPHGADHRYRHLLSNGTHLAMSAAMLAMVWASFADRWGLQLSFFAIAGGCYAVRAVLARPADRAVRLELLHQAIAMAAMVWMECTATGTRSTGNGMAGMNLAGLTTQGVAIAEPGVAATAVTLALAGYLGLATLWWLRHAQLIVVHRPSHTAVGRWLSPAAHAVAGTTGDAICQAVLAAAATVLLTRML